MNNIEAEIKTYDDFINYIDNLRVTTNSLLITADDPPQTWAMFLKIIKPENRKKFTLKELQDYVGGYIQVVPLIQPEWKDFVVLVNEEGMLLNLPLNPVSYPLNFFLGHKLFGNVLIIHKSNWE
tara:strand:- start:371 stop:742 length:372 start_codon:yes stop_codon:yes gene_type:complete